METAAAAPGKMAAAKSGAGGASHQPLPLVSGLTARAGLLRCSGLPEHQWLVEGQSSLPMIYPPTEPPSTSSPADWLVPQARHSPAYLSAETSSAAMAAVVVDSEAIVPLKWWTSERNETCEENREFWTPDLLGDRKWQIRDPARLGPSYIPGPLPRPPTSGSSPPGLKGQDSTSFYPKDTPTLAV